MDTLVIHGHSLQIADINEDGFWTFSMQKCIRQDMQKMQPAEFFMETVKVIFNYRLFPSESATMNPVLLILMETEILIY